MNIHNKNLKYLTRIKIPYCLNWILELISCLTFHSHHQLKNNKNWPREEKKELKRWRNVKNNWERKKREELDLKFALEVSKNLFCINDSN